MDLHNTRLLDDQKFMTYERPLASAIVVSSSDSRFRPFHNIHANT